MTKFFYQTELDDFKATAHWLALRGWSEAAGGNMSIRLDCQDSSLADLPEDDHIKLPVDVPYLAGKAVLLTGSGTRAREIGVDPLPHIGLYKISEDGRHYGWVAGNNNPSMELPAHFAIHNTLERHRPEDKAVLHTHPVSLIALCHMPEFNNGFNNAKTISDKILSMQSEARLILPEGIGFVKHELPGSLELGLKSALELKRHHLVLWQYHGLLATGETLAGAFDKVEVLEKSAQIYWQVLVAGLDPKGIKKAEIKHTLKAFGRLERYFPD
ncbi:MAG: rhamnulose-1-phosphate aldolase [Robiginitomaculum sp.]|nr:MAG: rhamnulose-1-phosphate aldolase [Robiginitomaculum sp.]